MNWKYKIDKLKEKVGMGIAWMLPRWLVYYASIRLMAKATQGCHGTTIVPDLKATLALKRWKEQGTLTGG